MRYTGDPEDHTKEKIGSDVRNILKGKDVRQDTAPLPDLDDPEFDPDYERSSAQGSGGSPGGSFTEGGRKKKKRGAAYIFVSYAFVLIFLLLVAHLIYFNVKLKDDIQNSPFNKRQNSAAEYIIRGKIKSGDGETLAETEMDEDGHERRVYPKGRVYAHVVGYDSHGKSGIESRTNYQLLTSHSNPLDQIINEFKGEKNPGDTVVTTLDSSLQKVAYEALGDYRGAIVALDPETGAIRAMVSKPDFDPNEIADAWDSITADSSNSQLLNRATQGLYAPGSTFKIVTALTYYRKYGSFSGFHYTCTGALPIKKTTVHCYGGEAHGELDLPGAFAHSCNTSFSKIGLDVGTKRLTDTADSLLFGQKLPSAVATTKSQWHLEKGASDDDLVQTAFGQGRTLTTPYHMALIVSAIANKGVLMKPNLIDHVENDAGVLVSQSKARRERQLLSAKEAEALDGLLQEVVKSGTGRALADRGYQAGGKTGSADYNKADGTPGTHSWFVGYGQKDGKKLVLAVLAEDGGAGSSTAVPMAGRLFDHYFGS